MIGFGLFTIKLLFIGIVVKSGRGIMVTGPQHGSQSFDPVLVYQRKIVLTGEVGYRLLGIIQVVPDRFNVGIGYPVFAVLDTLLVPPEQIQSVSISVACIVDKSVALLTSPSVPHQVLVVFEIDFGTKHPLFLVHEEIKGEVVGTFKLQFWAEEQILVVRILEKPAISEGNLAAFTQFACS
jgi:hypothetical protein